MKISSKYAYMKDLRGELEEFCRQRRSIFYAKTDLDITNVDSASLAPLRKKHALINPNVIGRICSSHFGKSVVSVIPLSDHGTFHTAYKAVFSDREKYVVRTNAARRAQFAFEFIVDSNISTILRQRNIPVVRVYHVDLSRTISSFDYEILEEARGTSLASLENIETQYLEPRLLSELGRSVAKVHNIATGKFGLLDLRVLMGDESLKIQGLLETWKEYIFLNLHTHLLTCLAINAVSFEESRIIERALEQASSLLANAPSCLLHGDLGNHNVFSDGRRITAIIDWEDSLCGDPVFDIAFWGTFCRDYMLDDFLNGYTSVKQLPRDFRILYWLYYLRIALSKTVHRYRFRYRDRPGRPPASRRIQKSLEMLRSLGWV